MKEAGVTVLERIPFFSGQKPRKTVVLYQSKVKSALVAKYGGGGLGELDEWITECDEWEAVKTELRNIVDPMGKACRDASGADGGFAFK